MGVISVRDQTGAPVWGVPGRLGLRGSQPFDANTFEEKHVDRAGHIDFEFAAIGICTRLALDPKTQLWTLHINHNEGFNSDWQHYSNASVDLGPDEILGDKGASIVLQRAGSGGGTLTTVAGPGGQVGYGTVQEWKAIVHTIVAKLPPGAIMEPLDGPQPNLRFVDAEVKKVHPFAFLQYNSGNELKPRFFAPTADQSNLDARSQRPCDFGSFRLPFFHDNDGRTDVWDPTGRPPSSAW